MRRRRRAYPTDLTDAQWAAIAELVPDAQPGGRPRRASPRELVNAILYALRGGQAWRLLPHDFPPWQTVYYYLRRWQAEGVWERVHHAVLMADRELVGREASPTAAIIDSQPMPPPRQGLGADEPERPRLPALGLRSPHAPKALPENIMIPDGPSALTDAVGMHLNSESQRSCFSASNNSGCPAIRRLPPPPAPANKPATGSRRASFDAST